MRFSLLATIFATVFWPTALLGFVQSSGKLPEPTSDRPVWSPNRDDEQPILTTVPQYEQAEAGVSQRRALSDQLISLVFNDTRLTEVIEQLKIETGLDIRLGDRVLRQKNVSIRIKRQRAKQVLETLASQIDAYVEFDSARSIYLSLIHI